MPALAPELQPVAALRARSGPPRSRACPQDVEPRGQTLMEDGSVADGWDGWVDGGRWVDGTPALAAGPGCGARSRDGQERPASQASRDRPRVWVAVGSRAGFPGGPAVSRVLSGPWAAPLPLSRGPCCVCLPAPPHRCRPSSSSRVCDRLCPLPPPLFPTVWDRAGLASRGCRLPASVGRWRPRVEQCPRSPERGAGRGSLGAQ